MDGTLEVVPSGILIVLSTVIYNVSNCFILSSSGLVEDFSPSEM